MNRPQLHARTRQILFDAYYNDTLQHGNCYACAVGNIIAANMGYKFSFISHKSIPTLRWENAVPKWGYIFQTSLGIQVANPDNYFLHFVREQIDTTGYTWQELARVEFAFETAASGDSEEDHMFNGLVAVLDVLDQIHEAETPSPALNRRLCPNQ